MTTEELAELTTAWQGLAWEARCLSARWLAGVLKSQAALSAATMQPAEGVTP